MVGHVIEQYLSSAMVYITVQIGQTFFNRLQLYLRGRTRYRKGQGNMKGWKGEVRERKEGEEGAEGRRRGGHEGEMKNSEGG